MYVYVAGPTTGRMAGGVRDATLIADLLMDQGHTPFIPHFKYFWAAFSSHSNAEWATWRLRWLRRCDALLRLPGDAPEADQEVALAKRLKKPIYFALDDIPDPAPREGQHGS